MGKQCCGIHLSAFPKKALQHYFMPSLEYLRNDVMPDMRIHVPSKSFCLSMSLAKGLSEIETSNFQPCIQNKSQKIEKSIHLFIFSGC